MTPGAVENVTSRDMDTVEGRLGKLEMAAQAAYTETKTAGDDDSSEIETEVAVSGIEGTLRIEEVDPLGVDLPQAIAHLASSLEQQQISIGSTAQRVLRQLKTWAAVPEKSAMGDALDGLSALLLAEGLQTREAARGLQRGGAEWTDGQLTAAVAAAFRPLLVDLTARWAAAEAASRVFARLAQPPPPEDAVHLSVAYAAGLLAGTAPQISGMAMEYFSAQMPACLAEQALGAADEETAEQTLVVAWRLLRQMPEALDVAAWDWRAPLTALMGAEHAAAVRVLACECLALATGLTESARARLAAQQQLDADLVVRTRAWLEGGSRWAAARLAELTASQNREMRQVWQAGCAWVDAAQLSSGVASVGGVLLAAHSGAADEGLVVTQRVARHVHAAALATARREAVLVQGAAGSGKTALVEWLARRTGNALVTLHVGGNMDAKVLLGSYVAAQRAGAFEWRAGLLATAVAQGQWVLVEGVDQAPADVVQTLLPLVESHTLFIPSRGEAIRAHPRFRLFATLAGRGRASGDALVGSSMWSRVTLLPPHDDHAEIVAGAFPRLAAESAALARVFAAVAAATAARHTSGAVLGTRDLMRWCARLSHRGMHDAFAIFQDAVDVFAAREPDHGRWRTLVRRIGVELGVGADRADHYVDQHSPQVVAAGRELTAGRVRLALGDAPTDSAEHMPFADTRHARCLLEQIAACVQLAEPALLLGETGTGKTTAVQRLATLAGRRLSVFNLSQQSDAADLLGGFRPVDVARVALQLRDDFDGLFARTLSVRKNAAFLDRVRAAFGRSDWRRLGALFRAGAENAQQMVAAAQEQLHDGPQRKRPRLALGTATELGREWDAFLQRVADFEAVRGARVAFRFVEGALAQAARSGAWLLLDEVNLAAPETLACLGGLLQRERMLLLPETGARIACHPDFRLFACMNPATDVGKRDLPPALRNGFIELFVHPPDAHADDLLRIVHAHLPRNTPDALCRRVIAFYRAAKALAADHRVVDGAGQRPHYSLRTLVRALTYARDHTAAYSLRRALHDGLVMTFATQLEGQTQPELLRELHAVFDGAGLAQLLRHVPPAPSADAVLEQGFWLAAGSEGRSDDAEGEYVVTESVEAKIGSLARAVMCGRYPVLIQGPTSAGKTSMVEHLARRTGHRFVRINNHEHTDLQEYLGAYATRDGRLVFEEGLLVQALRHGHWLVLDELNLAPSDVLEALNRLLDDNRELVIPETQEVVRPHPHFMLFATQNPAGLYGGRKQLSRAFRNRFVELHFDDIPAGELQRIVVESCRVPPSHAQLLVDVYGALTQARAQTRIFEARHGFITLRDLFRWARRGAASRDELAEHGYMLLAERTRSADDRSVVRRAIERVFYPRAASSAGGGRVRRAIDVDALYSEERLRAMPEFQALAQASDVAWTSAMRRLFVLTALCLRFDEPVLLVGETGTGKTTVCQLLATALGRRLHAVSCHQNTEAADVLGAQRPVRNRNALVAAAQELLAAAMGKEAAEQIDTSAALAAAVPADDPRVVEARELLERAEAPFAWHDGPL
ncbi:AAA ATPase midasin, partial [Coemansia guatemalensis]